MEKTLLVKWSRKLAGSADISGAEEKRYIQKRHLSHLGENCNEY